MIRSILHRDIDKDKWDCCLGGSLQPLPYARAWYLDLVCPGWHALVLDDYQAVMPLTCNTRFGIHYLYQPFFTQQLGVFSQSTLSDHMTDEFLKAIPGRYSFIDINLNESNHCSAKEWELIPRKTFLLPLAPSAELLSSGFSRNCRRNIRRAGEWGLYPDPAISNSQFTEFIGRHLEARVRYLGRNFYSLLVKVVSESLARGCGRLLGVRTASGELVAAAWFLGDDRRLVFQVCASSEQGRQMHAMYLLVSHAILGNAGSGMVFDFAGSNIPGVAYFNSTFGARPVIYQRVYLNRLPRIVRWLKKP